MSNRSAATASVAIATLLLVAVANEPPPDAAADARYIGSAECAKCHPHEFELWQRSDHDLAMQVASESTVLGDFADATYTHFGVKTTFSKRDGRFLVRTYGPDGSPTDYEVKYTFGVDPLQQYLIEFPDGRLQVLGVSWDARPKQDGGQRWFHVYPHEAIPAGDELHWTGPNQNWNHVCAECHSTDVHKGYDPRAERFATTWAALNVSCEACHGPASLHREWARRAAEKRSDEADPPDLDLGLAIRFPPRAGFRWRTDPETGLPIRSAGAVSRLEVETCARCHSRRARISESVRPGQPLADTHRIALLDEALYFPDGQIREEVYVYGSFLQSRMFAEGVSCSDCHDPHSTKLVADGNALCTRCHDASRFDSAEHHHHEISSPGARCVECHMPARTYMVIDPRRDHSLRIPRPDLSEMLGTPNACTGCHADRSNAWAAASIDGWRGRAKKKDHWGQAIHAGRTGSQSAEAELVRLVRDSSAPAIARATALSLLPRYATPASLPVIRAALTDPDPLVRREAATSLEGVEPGSRRQWLGPLLGDPIRSVRLEAGRALADIPDELLDPATRDRRAAVLREYRAVQEMDADRADAQLRLGTLFLREGQAAASEAAFTRALAIDADFVPSYVNLADLYRTLNRDEDAARILRRGIEVAPQNAALHHALGLTLVRQKRLDAAIQELETAAALSRGEPRYSYVLAVALHSAGRTKRAIAVLEDARERHPADRDIRSFLAQLTRAP